MFLFVNLMSLLDDEGYKYLPLEIVNEFLEERSIQPFATEQGLRDAWVKYDKLEDYYNSL